MSLSLLIEHFNEKDVAEEELPERFWIDQSHSSTGDKDTGSVAGQKRPREKTEEEDIEVL